MIGARPVARLRRLVWLSRTSTGRTEIGRRIGRPLWPLAAPAGRLYRRSVARRATLVVVVGSVGKTTAMRAVSVALGLPVHRQALLNANSLSAVTGSLLRIRPWHRLAVQEVGIGGPGEMAVHARTLRPDVVVVTAVASDHWRSMPSLEIIRHEKAMMVRALPPSGLAVLNVDDENVRWMAGLTGARVIGYGFSPTADVRCVQLEISSASSMSCTIELGGERRTLATRLVGRHMVYPLLAAVAVAVGLGQALDDAVAALAELEPTPGRVQPLRLAGGAVLLMDDFKATGAALYSAIDTLAELPARRRVVVLGDMDETVGSRKAAYRDAGTRLAEVADLLVLVGGSGLKKVRTGAVAGGLGPDRVIRVPSAQAAVSALRELGLGEGDVVLVKGRWQQGMARVGLALSGRQVLCQADPCPFKRMLCQDCSFLERPFRSVPA